MAAATPFPRLVNDSDLGMQQYASDSFRRLLKAHGIMGSMGRKGDCWYNAAAVPKLGRLITLNNSPIQRPRRSCSAIFV